MRLSQKSTSNSDRDSTADSSNPINRFMVQDMASSGETAHKKPREATKRPKKAQSNSNQYIELSDSYTTSMQQTTSP